MNKILLFLIIPFYLTTAQTHDHYYNYKTSDKNNIHISFNNIGCLQYGRGFWNELDPAPNQILYDSGPWILGKINGVHYAEITEWTSQFSPGPIINGQPGILVNPQDSLRYRIYKINKGDDGSNPDYAEWPDDLGAPLNHSDNPMVYGDQTLWSVYNGVDSTLSTRNLYNNYFPPMPVEIRQTIFSHEGSYHDYQNILSNIIFLEWTIINKGDQQIDSAYFGLWTDIDFAPLMDNIPAVDTINQIAYCWSNTSNESGTAPAVGFKLLYGPSIVSDEDTAIFRGRKLPGYKNIKMNSFHAIGDDSYPPSELLYGPARSVQNAWNFARGLDAVGDEIIDPTSNTPTKFPFSGDPLTQQGWLFPVNALGGGSGFVFFSGPFNLAPFDTQWVMAAVVPGIGNSPDLSISYMRQKAQLLNSIPYDSLISGNPVYGITNVKNEKNSLIPSNYKLYQNYPNPFNPSTTIKFEIPVKSNVKITVYNILGREVSTLINEVKNPGIYKVEFNGENLSSGVYFYKLQTDNYVTMKKMIILK